jgi:glucosamine-phosphate N-acetyltransferase
MTSKERINFMVRELQHVDVQNGFLQTLSNLAQVDNSIEGIRKAEKILLEIKPYPFYKIFVAVKDDGQIIGSTTLLMEQKFIHDGARVGHIEDVSTRREYEGKGIGSALIQYALRYAKKENCYKVVLDCSEKNVQFYKRIGFKKHEVSMRYDLI